MIYNSEIIILNDTPERGTVTGKRMRLTGTQGKLYAKTIDKIYKFGRWETPDGQVISTSNPLIINDWQHQFIRVVFEHVLLSDQMFAERDAIATQTHMLETMGVETGPYTSTVNYFSQKNIAGPATRTTTYGVTYPTGNKTYGYRADDATWDPDGDPPANPNYRGTITGTWFKAPDRYDFYPLSGLPAEQFNMGWTSKFRRRHRRRMWKTAATSGTLYQWGLDDVTLAAGSWGSAPIGAYHNPSVGTPSLYPMYEWLPTTAVYKNLGLEPVDLTGLETSEVYNLHFTSHYSGRLMYNNLHNIDAASEMPIKTLTSDHSKGLVPGTYEYANWHTNGTHPINDHGVSPTKHDTSAYKTSPRVLEPLGYTSINTLFLRSQSHWRQSYEFSGPMDTTRNDSTGDLNVNPHWVKKWQFVPHSGSLLWSLRYTPLEDFRVGPTTHISDFSSFKHYFKNLKHVAMNQPNWDNYGQRHHAGQSLPGGAGLKNIKSFQWYENYYHTSFNIDEPFDWSGLKDMTNLRSLYIQHSYDTYTKYLDLADIPPSVVDLHIQPTAYLFNEQFPEETVRHKLSIDNTQIVDKSKYKNNNDITTTTLNIISTS